MSEDEIKQVVGGGIEIIGPTTYYGQNYPSGGGASAPLWDEASAGLIADGQGVTGVNVGVKPSSKTIET